MKITLDAQTLDLNPSGRGYNASLGDRLVPVEVIRAGDGDALTQQLARLRTAREEIGHRS